MYSEYSVLIRYVFGLFLPLRGQKFSRAKFLPEIQGHIPWTLLEQVKEIFVPGHRKIPLNGEFKVGFSFLLEGLDIVLETPGDPWLQIFC